MVSSTARNTSASWLVKLVGQLSLIQRILRTLIALRGDPPKDRTNFTPHPNGLSYANELVELIREVHPECAIGVAGYPEKTLKRHLWK